MEDMVSKIVEMDKKARDLTAEAQKSKVDYEQDVVVTKEKIKNDFIERALARIKINEQTERENAKKKLEQIEQKNAAIAQNLEKRYADYADAWVEEIVSRVIGQKS
ncbi:MAG: hypothetical protein ACI4M3_02530 [Acutalibacteraceae bacterium]